MKARTRKWIGVLAGMSVPMVAFAEDGSGAATMIKGIEALRQIFGVDATSLATLIGGSGTPTILAAVTTILNTAAMTATALFIMMTFFTGAMQQAHEGVMLGRRYSTLWVPLRAVISFFYLVPLSSGYSVLQILVLWVAMWGSLLCDKAWEVSVSFMGNNASVVGVPVLPKTRDLVSQMYQSAVCAKRLNDLGTQAGQSFNVQRVERGATQYQAAPTVSAQFSPFGAAISGGSAAMQYQLNTPPPEVISGVSYDANGSFNGSSGLQMGLCGAYMVDRRALSIPDNVTASEQQQNLANLSTELEGVAQDAVDNHASMENVRYRLIMAEARFSAAERARAVTYVAMTADAITQKRVEQLQFSRDAGWMSAGAWYMTFSALSDTVASQIAVAPTYQGPKFDQMPQSFQNDLAPYLKRASILTNPGLMNPSSASSSSLPSQMSGSGFEITAGGAPDGNAIINVDNQVSQLMQSALDSMNNVLKDRNPATMLIGAMGAQSGADPVVVISEVGHDILGVAEAAMAAAMLVAFAAGFVGSGPMIYNTCIAIIGPFLLGAGALAYYIPLLPYIYWILGIASWLLMLIEAVAVVPLWAAAHALPEGEGWAGTHARQGYTLVVSLIARPVLMLLGLFGAMLLMRFLCLLIGVTFKWAMDATQGAHSMGLASMLGYFVILAGLYISAARVSFSLIHMVPDRALRFIGIGESLGELGGERHTHAGAAMIAGLVIQQLNKVSPSQRKPGGGKQLQNSLQKP